MTDESSQPGHELTQPDDENLGKELESMYQRVASLDTPRAAGDSFEGPEPYEGTLENGHSPITPLTTATVLTPENSDLERAIPVFETATDTTTSSSASSPASSSTASAGASAGASSGNRLRWVIGTVSALLIILVIAFFWSGIYDFDEKDRFERPVRPEAKQGDLTKQAPAQPPLTAPSAGNTAINEVKPGENIPSAVLKGQQEVVAPKENMPPVLPQVRKEIVTSEPLNKKAEGGKPYAIQIVAYQEKDIAMTFAKKLKLQKDKLAVRVEEVDVKGKGIWHRVLLGQFENRIQAQKYYHDHKIGKIYPDSFIQKSVNF